MLTNAKNLTINKSKSVLSENINYARCYQINKHHIDLKSILLYDIIHESSVRVYN